MLYTTSVPKVIAFIKPTETKKGKLRQLKQQKQWIQPEVESNVANGPPVHLMCRIILLRMTSFVMKVMQMQWTIAVAWKPTVLQAD